jgi:cytochrome c peroxidase
VKYRKLIVSCVVLLVAGAWSRGAGAPDAAQDRAAKSGPSRARILASIYEDWEVAYEAAGGDSARVLTMRWARGLSTAPSTSRWGQVKLNRIDGTVQAAVVGPMDQPLDLWVVQNVPGEGRSAQPDAGDRIAHLGTLPPTAGVARLETTLPKDFNVDLAVVTQGGQRPEEGILLQGSTNLFEHLYDREHARGVGLDVIARNAPEPWFFGVLGIPPAAAASHPDDESLEALIKQGERLFTEETFDGNSRTCASCHPPENNFTIDPEFVQHLHDTNPLDPLFVAEFVPALECDTGPDPAVCRFETPDAMHELALIQENVDGGDDLATRFALRATPHTLALSTSVDVFLLDTEQLVEATGWSGDGSRNGADVSNSGEFEGADALDNFANGAINQHFTKTLDRIPGADFRFADQDELDAMEAFQLSLGRQDDISLDEFHPRNAHAQAGQVLFTEKHCEDCHNNAGANDDDGDAFFAGHPAAGNVNFNTGVENLLLGQDFGFLRPRDGGFGQAVGTPVDNSPVEDAEGPVDCSGFPAIEPGFGDGTFNTPPLIEAADTPPYFHNNAAETLEDAIAFYDEPEFNCSPGGRLVGGIDLQEEEVDDVAAFLRVLNTVENIRSAGTFIDDAEDEHSSSNAVVKIDASLEEIGDGITVLAQQDLHQKDAARELKKARVYLKAARHIDNRRARNILLDRAEDNLETATRDLIED